MLPVTYPATSQFILDIPSLTLSVPVPLHPQQLGQEMLGRRQGACEMWLNTGGTHRGWRAREAPAASAHHPMESAYVPGSQRGQR